MMFLDSPGYVTAAASTGTTLAGIAFWVVLLAIHVALFLFVLRGIVRAPLSQRSRVRWVWLVGMAPGIGIIAWFVRGRPATQSGPHGA